jgi:hypothetical protein
VIIVFSQYFSKKFMLGVMNGFDDVFVIPREIKEASAFPWGSKLGEYVFAG